MAVLALTGSRLKAVPAHPVALDAHGVTVDRGVFASGLKAKGAVRLAEARVGGSIKFAGARLRALGDHTEPDGTSLDLDGVVAGAAELRFATVPPAAVSLRGARLTTLDLRPALGAQAPARWIPTCRLGDCSYETIKTGGDPCAQIGWLARDPDGVAVQPYEELAAFYRKTGRDGDARRVAVGRHRRHRASLSWRKPRCWPAKVWSWFLDVTVGYGYRPWQAGYALLALVAVGTALFGLVFSADAGGPHAADPPDLDPAREAGQVPPFQPLIYTVDVLVPVISLGQRIAWNAHGAAQWTAFVLTLAGWLLTTALIAGVAVRRL